MLTSLISHRDLFSVNVNFIEIILASFPFKGNVLSTYFLFRNTLLFSWILNSFCPGSKGGTCKTREMWNLDYSLKKLQSYCPLYFLNVLLFVMKCPEEKQVFHT